MSSGYMGLYDEDSEVNFDNVKITNGAMMGAGSAGQSGANIGGVDPPPFCNTGVMTPICR